MVWRGREAAADTPHLICYSAGNPTAAAFVIQVRNIQLCQCMWQLRCVAAKRLSLNDSKQTLLQVASGRVAAHAPTW